MKRLIMFSAPAVLSAPLVAAIMLEAQPGLAQCCMFLDTYGVYGPRCNYWELCSNKQPVSSPGSVPNTSSPVGKFRDGQLYVNKDYFYGAYSEAPEGKPLDIRSGPGTNYPIVDRVPNGVFLSMTGAMKQDSTGEWWTELHTKTWVYTNHTR